MSQSARFTHIHLENWRNFAKAAADLEARVIVAGPNAAGKSNLLDAFRFLHDVAAIGGFQDAVRRRGGISKLRCLAARHNSDVLIRIRATTEAAWEYELAFTHSDELDCPVIRCERVSTEAGDVFCRPDDQDRRDPLRLTQSCLEQWTANQAVRELVEFLRSVRYSGRPREAWCSGLIGEIAGTNESTRHSRLRRILKGLQQVVPQLTDLQMWRDVQGAPHLRARYEHWRSRGAWQTEEEFSDGTLRLIGLLWAALDGDGPMLIEEPELSLDPHIVRSVPDLLSRMLSRSGNQAIVTTHTPELFAYDSVKPNEVLLLTPGDEGTEIHTGVEFPLIRQIMETGIRLADMVGDTEPPIDERQMGLFAEE